MKNFIAEFIKTFWRDDDGPTMAEYGILLGLIALSVIAAAAIIGTEVNAMFGEVGTVISTS